METKVIPFNPTIKEKQSSIDIANNIQSMIQVELNNGWNLHEIKVYETTASGSNGCFGFGATPDRHVQIGFIVFTR